MKITYNVDCMHNLAKLIIKFMRLSFPKVQSRISNCTIEWYLVARNINAREHTCVHILKYSKSTIVRVSSFLHFLCFVSFFFFHYFRDITASYREMSRTETFHSVSEKYWHTQLFGDIFFIKGNDVLAKSVCTSSLLHTREMCMRVIFSNEL